jgi:hypothetical protein
MGVYMTAQDHVAYSEVRTWMEHFVSDLLGARSVRMRMYL